MKFIIIILTSFFQLLDPGVVFSQLKGNFEIVGDLPLEGTLNEVVVEEFINFTCPHCNNFRNQSKPLFDKYNNRIKHVNVPVIFRGQSDLPSRLFFIAKSLGLEKEAKISLFDAVFQFGVNIFDPAVVNYLAKSMGIGKEFSENINKFWVDNMVEEARLKSNKYTIRATPTVVIQHSMKIVPKGGMQLFIGEIDGLIGQLLKKKL